MRPKSIFKVAPGITGMRTVMVNLFFVSSGEPPNAWVLVDAGVRGWAHRIRKEAENLFGPDYPPSAVVLTHGHFDHTGGLPELLQHWEVPVYAQRDELPFVNEGMPYPPPDPKVGGGLLAASSVLFSRHSSKLRQPVLKLPDDGSVPSLPGWKWVPTPGHSPGHVSFWRAADRVLISGDAIVSTRQESLSAVWSQRKEVRPPPAYFTCDWHAAFDSMRRLEALDPAVLASGHGLPLRGLEWREELKTLLAQFPQRGLPRHGHYVRETWPQAFAT